MNKSIFVYFDAGTKTLPIFMGTLFVGISRGNEIFSFEYDADWLRTTTARVLDPHLVLSAGRQYAPPDKANFGLFLDSAPDRWGRVLLRRREAFRAQAEGRRERTLSETDFLLGVFDEGRMGALRFKTVRDGNFLDDDASTAIPPATSLRALAFASEQLGKDEKTSGAETVRWLNMLVAPGSSLGGARPKACVKDLSGELWIAKFPSRSDETDVGAWEFVATKLAEACGIETAQCRVEKFGKGGRTFLVKRFDRERNRRIHFASAMTLLGYNDGADSSAGASYLEIAELLERDGATADRDLEQLWLRIVFNIAISNCDDHLRNHGFLLTPKGWKLSPAYDLNPNADGTGLTLNISENSNALDFGLALGVAKYFGLSRSRAEQILKKVRSRVSQWRTIAEQIRIPKSEQERMGRAFRFCDEI